MSKEKQNTPTNTPTQNQFTNSELTKIEVITYENERLNYFTALYEKAKKKFDRLFEKHKDAPYLSDEFQKMSDAGRGTEFLGDVVKMLKQSEWISVEERLPDNDWGKHEDRKYYLVFTKPSGLMNVAVYGYKEYDWWVDMNSCVLDKNNYKEVTHWMPLPDAPKGGAE